MNRMEIFVAAGGSMTDFNPLSGAILGSAQVQSNIETDKQRQLRRAQAVRKGAAGGDDQHDHEVESSEELHAIDDGGQEHSQHQKRDPRRPSRDKQADRSHIDVKA